MGNINNILSSIDFTEEQKEYFKKALYSMQEFVDLQNDELDKLITPEKISFNLKNKISAKKLTLVIDNILKVLKLGGNLEKMIENLRKEWPSDQFWDVFVKAIDKMLEPYNNTKILTIFTDDELKIFFREIMENCIIYNNDLDVTLKQIKKIITEQNINEEHVEIGTKIIEYVIELIIGERYPYERFMISAQDTFGLSSKICDILWEIVNRNKEELRTRYIIAKLQNLA